jgi:hypothetical protein
LDPLEKESNECNARTERHKQEAKQDNEDVSEMMESPRIFGFENQHVEFVIRCCRIQLHESLSDVSNTKHMDDSADPEILDCCKLKGRSKHSTLIPKFQN